MRNKDIEKWPEITAKWRNLWAPVPFQQLFSDLPDPAEATGAAGTDEQDGQEEEQHHHHRPDESDPVLVRCIGHPHSDVGEEGGNNHPLKVHHLREDVGGQAPPFGPSVGPLAHHGLVHAHGDDVRAGRRRGLRGGDHRRVGIFTMSSCSHWRIIVKKSFWQIFRTSEVWRIFWGYSRFVQFGS